MKTGVLTAAEFLSKPIEMLEARRKELYQKCHEFIKDGKEFLRNEK
ncbi:MAG: hypothetical protein QXU74_00985 [Candidatus Aenigmatarchaeota archaeon]